MVWVEDGFDFLGIHFQLCLVSRKNAKVKKYCVLWFSDRSIKRIKGRIKEVVRRRYSLSLEELIKELNPMLRGKAVGEPQRGKLDLRFDEGAKGRKVWMSD